jgi:hypothetical protein
VTSIPIGIPPRPITIALRVEGAVALIAGVSAYWVLGGNWWLFALLFLAPDLSMLGYLLGGQTGARVYNTVHTYTLPALLAALGYFSGAAWLVPLAAIWVAHIGMDRALGYGLKYDAFGLTHLGLMGRKKRSDALADASQDISR